MNWKLLEWVDLIGRVYTMHKVEGGVYVLRFAVGATLTEERHGGCRVEFDQGRS